MDGFINYLSGLMQIALQKLYEIFVTVIIQVAVDFFMNVVEYFKSLNLKRNVHTAFIMNTEKNTTNPLSSLISDELSGKGVIEGVYNKNTDSIESLRYIGGEGLDKETEKIIKENPIVVLN